MAAQNIWHRYPGLTLFNAIKAEAGKKPVLQSDPLCFEKNKGYVKYKKKKEEPACKKMNIKIQLHHLVEKRIHHASRKRAMPCRPCLSRGNLDR